MKIGIVLSRPPAYSESFLISKITGLIKNGFKVELFVNKPDQSFKICEQYSLPHDYINGAVLLLMTLIRHPLRVAKFIHKEYKYRRSPKSVFINLYNNLHLLNSNDLNWVHFSFMTTSIGRENIAEVLNAKMGVSIRGYDISRYPLNHPGVYKYSWRKIHKLHYLSEALLNKAYKEGLENKPEITCVKITPAVNINDFYDHAHSFKVNHPIKFLTIARLHWAKGLDHTIQALYYLHKSDVDFTYTIIGDGTELERLTYSVYMYGLQNKVRFMGKVSHDKLRDYYDNCDIYLQYSIQEGFCNAVLEAQAMGLPCIVSDAGGLPENIIDNTTGWVVQACNPHLLAGKISDVLSTSSDEINVICKNAQQRVKNNFNIKNQEMQFAQFFSQ